MDPHSSARPQARHRRGSRLPWFLTASHGMATRGSGSGAPSRAPPFAPSRPRSTSTTPSSAASRRHSNSTPPSSDAARATTSSDADAPTSDAPPPPDGTDVEIVDVDDNVAVGGKRKRRSDVWNEFEECIVAGKDKAKCNWCKKLLAASSNDGTNHLRGHLRVCPSRQVQKGMKQATLRMGKDQSGAVVVEKYVFDQQVARKELALMICIHEYPLSMVDHAGFRRFCEALQPLFKHVSRNTIKKDILDMYEVYRLSLVNVLQKSQSRLAVTTDLWTANHQRKGYMAVTVHYLDDDWKLKSFLLR